ncbi:hypothetical protein [Vibrio zhugei]|nr:hypothetical protein [Vibrio zhugei]
MDSSIHCTPVLNDNKEALIMMWNNKINPHFFGVIARSSKTSIALR